MSAASAKLVSADHGGTEQHDRGARARILAAAEEVFAHGGYEGGSLRQVA